MAFVLREGFTEGGSDLSAARDAPAAAAFEVLVDAVLLQEPVALAGVACHFYLASDTCVILRSSVYAKMN